MSYLFFKNIKQEEFDIPVYPIMYCLTQKAYEILKSKHK